jgi:hypothetical protein
MDYVVRPVRAEMIRDQTSERRSTQRQQLSAASTQRRLIWAPRQLGAVTTERRRQLSAVFLSSQSVQLSATYVTSALLQLTTDTTQCFLKKKDQQQYKLMFSKLKEKWSTLNPQSMMMDFEVATRKAVKSVKIMKVMRI